MVWTYERRVLHEELQETLDEQEEATLDAAGTIEYFTLARDWLETKRRIGDLVFIARSDGDYRAWYERYCNLLEKSFGRVERRERRANLQFAVNLFMVRVGNCPEGRTVFAKLLLEIVQKVERTKSRSFEQRMRKNHEIFDSLYGEKVFSPVTRRSIPVEDAEPMYIVPTAIKEKGMRLLFGPDVPKGELHSPMNGLWCPRGFENGFNRFEFVFVPAPSNKKGEEPREWQILALNKLICKRKDKTHIFDSFLHKRILRFENDVRPRARYFYFRYLMAMAYLSYESRNSNNDPLEGYPVGATKMADETSNFGLGVSHLLPQKPVEAYFTGEDKVEKGTPTMTADELAKAWAPKGEYMSEIALKSIVEQIPELSKGAKKKILRNSLKLDTPKSGTSGVSAGRPEREVVAELVDATDDMDLESNFGT